MEIFKLIMIMIIMFALYNLRIIINKKRKYLLTNNKGKYTTDNTEIKQNTKYLKIIDCFLIFLLTLFIFNILLNVVPNISKLALILRTLIIFFTIVSILIIIFFKYNVKYENKSKIINVFLLINIVFIVLLFIIDCITIVIAI